MRNVVSLMMLLCLWDAGAVADTGADATVVAVVEGTGSVDDGWEDEDEEEEVVVPAADGLASA